MYSYKWDETTGGLLLDSAPLIFSKEPRPVYYQELDILGFDKFWNYEKNNSFPYMWAEANSYWYRGRKVAQTRGGSLYTAPELILLEEPESEGQPLRFVEIPAMVEKNRDLMEQLEQETIKRIFNTYVNYQDKVDVFYLAFSGGKDSVAVLDLVRRALPHSAFMVVFGDTLMENKDTYRLIDVMESQCKQDDIGFYRASAKVLPEKSWKLFGPPAATIRWCCSVHKTAPQISLLRELLGKHDFKGMAFTGIRSDESTSRSEYSEISFGGKHNGQYSSHPILEWNSAELFIYTYGRGLIINDSYKKGNSRVGCLICPMSSGKHEYMKYQSNPKASDSLLTIIRETSAKKSFSDAEMKEFIDVGNWKKRRSGRELSFPPDKHFVDSNKDEGYIHVNSINDRWKEWIKTIGDLSEISNEEFSIYFSNKSYQFRIQKSGDGLAFIPLNKGSSKSDIQFYSLFRSAIVKSIYCVNCGVCEAECNYGCIDMSNGLKISDSCRHCYRCHEIYERCLRYNSIRNNTGGEKQVIGLDRYYSFGVRKQWVESYFKHKGNESFWTTDGDSLVANKKKDAFLSFVKDAGLVEYNRKAGGDKYSRNLPTKFAETLFKIGAESDITWALLICNLAYSPQFNWYIKTIPMFENSSMESVKKALEESMASDVKGLGRRNVADSIRIIITQTPFGDVIGLGRHIDNTQNAKRSAESTTLNEFNRGPWNKPDPRVILYSLYKFAEACGDYHAFTLSRLLNHDIDSNGVSPTQMFGLGRDEMQGLLIGLGVNYPEFIRVAFNHDLDNINLNNGKTSQDLLSLF